MFQKKPGYRYDKNPTMAIEIVGTTPYNLPPTTLITSFNSIFTKMLLIFGQISILRRATMEPRWCSHTFCSEEADNYF